MLSNEILALRKEVQMAVINYYKYKKREVTCFLDTRNEEWKWTYLHFLIDKKKVIRYGFGIDRGIFRAGVEIAIGPHYFSAADFWSYEASERFIHDVDEQSIHHNLRLLDEFWSKHSVHAVISN